MLFQKTLRTKLSLAAVTDHDLAVLSHVDHALTLFLGAQLEVRILGNHLKLVDLFVLLLNVERKCLEKRAFQIHTAFALIVRA